jgi:beta-mannosidase
VRWSLETLDGVVLESGEQPVKAAPFNVTPVCRLDFSGHLNDDLRREIVFIAELCQGKQILSRQTAFFVPTKHLALAEPAISAQLHVEESQVCIELASRSLARLVECALEGADVVFSDNYFDLTAGRAVNISAPLPAGWTPSQMQAALKVRSVYDSYAHSAAK